jgi:hypothetical protein
MKHYEHTIGGTKDKKIKILTSELGGEAGFAWFTLLEWLGEAQDTFCIIFIDKGWYKSFETETNIATAKLKKIFKTMADLELIDPELFEQNIIMSQNFIRKHMNYLKKLTNFRNLSEQNLKKKLKIYFEYRADRCKLSMTYETFIEKLVSRLTNSAQLSVSSSQEEDKTRLRTINLSTNENYNQTDTENAN